MSWTEWWIYAVLTLSAFIGCLILNFIVKVINDARLEDRYLRIRQKASTNQGTQVHCPLAEITARAPRIIPLDNMLAKPNTTPNKISLVFNKEHYLQEKKKIENIIDSDEETASVKIISNATSGTRSSESIVKPTLLGNIYNRNKPDTNCNKQIFIKNNEDSAFTDKEDIERKSSINMKSQNYQDMKQWVVGLVIKITNENNK